MKKGMVATCVAAALAVIVMVWKCRNNVANIEGGYYTRERKGSKWFTEIHPHYQ